MNKIRKERERKYEKFAPVPFWFFKKRGER